MFKKDDQVRVKGDSSQVGITTGVFNKHGSRNLVQVNVIGIGLKNFPEEHLELIDTPLSPLEELKNNKIVGPEILKLILAHIRLSGKLADMIYSMESSNTKFLAYQFKPVIKIINSPSNSILIADEVGLGKTIEAGLIWTELRARYDASRFIVLCPYSLTKKWQEELINKFGIDAKVIKADELYNELSNSVKIEKKAAYICGMQSMRPDKNWQEEDYKGHRPKQRQLALLLDELSLQEPIFDFLIVDEAHHLRNEDTQIHKFASLLRNVSDHVAFLSATPIHLKNNDLFALLKLLDESSFDNIEYFKNLIEVNKPIIKARDLMLDLQVNKKEILSHIDEALNNSMLSKSNSLISIKDFINNKDLNNSNRSELASRLENVSLLSNIVTRMRRKDVQELRIIRNVKEVKVPMTDEERSFYSQISSKVKWFAHKKGINKGFLLSSPQRMLSSSMAAALKRWKYNSEIEWEEDLDFHDIEKESAEKNQLDADSLSQSLNEVCNSWDFDKLSENDSKLSRLLNLMKNDYKNEKIIIFTTFRATIEYLERNFESNKISFISIHGGIKGEQRQLNLKSFKEKKIQVLISSEVGSEGLDLQFCKHLINYDLPWNPMKVEQRIGRVDRFGQKSEYVTVINMIYEDTIDEKIYDRLFKRLKFCEEALGGFESILGTELRELENAIFFEGISEEQINSRIDQTAMALENKKIEQDNLEKEATGLIAHGDYILNKINAAKEFNRWITTEDIKNYIISFFKEYFPSSSLEQKNKSFVINLDSKCFTELNLYIQSLQDHPTTYFSREKKVKVNFGKLSDNYYVNGCEIINQKHPLVKFAVHKISRRSNQLTPAIYTSIDNTFNDESIVSGKLIICISKWSIESQTNFEKIFYKAEYTNTDKKLSSETAEKVINKILDYGKNVDVIDRDINNDNIVLKAEELFNDAQKDFIEFENNYKNELIDRVNFQLESTKKLSSIQEYKFREIINKHYAYNRKGLAMANEAKLRKINEKLEIKEAKLNNDKNFTANSYDVSIVIVDII